MIKNDKKTDYFFQKGFTIVMLNCSNRDTFENKNKCVIQMKYVIVNNIFYCF